MKGADKLIMKLGKIEGEFDNPQNLDDAVQFVRSAAVMLAPVGPSGGNLRNSIQTRVYQKDDGTHVGEVYTRCQYAMYVEFGTGPKGAADHAGTSPDAHPSYTPNPWWIHESQLDVGVAEMYHWHHIDTPEGRFYICYGQAAQPFMYPALKDNEQTVLDILKGGYEEAIRRVVR